MSGPGQDTASPAAAAPAPMSVFVVERRLPKVTEQQLAVLQAALCGAAGRFSARGDPVRYLRSIFLASLIPVASIEPAVEVPGAGQP